MREVCTPIGRAKRKQNSIGDFFAKRPKKYVFFMAEALKKEPSAHQRDLVPSKSLAEASKKDLVS